jgi:hypothetical protein
MPYHALAHARTMHDRYGASKRNPWNEVEWGSHYSRSMASYGQFTAVCGFEHHGPKGYIAFSPRLSPGDFRAAFTAAEGWGAFHQRRAGETQVDRLDLKWGRLRLRTLAFDLPPSVRARAASVTAAGRPVEAELRQSANRAVLRLAEPAAIQAGESLQVTIAYR